jgi:anti-sigma regulatory factor (Ser/Thr protein kinase)
LASGISLSEQHEAIIEPLTFDLVDDICLGLQGGALTLAEAPTSSARSLGPLFELMQVLGSGHCGGISPGIYESLAAARVENRPSWFHTYDNQGFIQVQRLNDDRLAWNRFSIQVSRAAQAAGFTNDEAWKLMAAIGEIYGNVIDHSERIDSGYVAYATNGRTFEFVVGDSGIGVLNSLRKNAAYTHIADSGTALEYALSEGVSRLQERGHGFGFQPIFVGLANISSRVRFRSGDYGREFQRSPDGSIPATTMQLAMINGLFCSVLCTASAERS